MPYYPSHGPTQGYLPGGVNYPSRPAPKKKILTGNKFGYAPGGFVYHPLTPKQRAQKVPVNSFAPSGTGGDTGGGDTTGTTTPPAENPYLASLKSQIEKQKQEAGSARLQQQKDLLLGFGSQSLARQVLGNDPFVGLISDNPDTSTSFLGRENFNYRLGQKNTNEDMSARNLFYGGARGVALNQLGRQHLLNVDSETLTTQSKLHEIQQSYLAQISALQNQLISAQMSSAGGVTG